jgi:hypothetical protein
MGKLTISMAMFNSFLMLFVCLPEGIYYAIGKIPQKIVQRPVPQVTCLHQQLNQLFMSCFRCSKESR